MFAKLRTKCCTSFKRSARWLAIKGLLGRRRQAKASFPHRDWKSETAWQRGHFASEPLPSEETDAVAHNDCAGSEDSRESLDKDDLDNLFRLCDVLFAKYGVPPRRQDGPGAVARNNCTGPEGSRPLPLDGRFRVDLDNMSKELDELFAKHPYRLRGEASASEEFDVDAPSVYSQPDNSWTSSFHSDEPGLRCSSSVYSDQRSRCTSSVYSQ